MNGHSNIEMDSARMRRVSPVECTVSRRKADCDKTGKMNSSEMIVKRKITPNTARTFAASSDQTILSVLGYSSS